MVNATTQTPGGNFATPPELTAKPPVASVAPTTPPKVGGNGIDKMKKNLKFVLAGLLVLVLVAGGGIAVFLSQQSQDVRQQASTAGCIEVPTARDPGVTAVSANRFKLQWNQVPGADGYRIFLITEGQAGTHSSGKYIVFNVLDNSNNVGETAQFTPIVPADASSLPATQIEYTWDVPQTNITDLEGFVVKERPYFRFLVYAFKNDVSCSSQAAIGMYTLPTSAASPTPTSAFVGSCSVKPVVENRTAEWINNYSQVKLSWKLTSGKVDTYQIWNIGYGTLDQLGADKYYLKNLTLGAELAGTTSTFTVTNPASLNTRRFLIRAVVEHNAQGEPSCYDQWALCIPPAVLDRKVEMPDASTAVFNWNPVQAPQEKYEIWLIGNGTLQDLGPQKYYIAKLADNIDPKVKTYRLTIPEQYRDTSLRFLIRAVNYSVDGEPTCYDQWALAVGSTNNGQCTMTFTISSPSTTPTNTPVPSTTPRATVTPTTGCNDLCTSNADCSNSSHICFTASDGENRCRLESNPTDVNCQNTAVASTNTPAPSQPALPETLPETGPEDWGNWLKAGLAILGVGAALLLML